MTHTFYPPGQEAPAWQAGDFLLTTNDGFLARAIRFGERRRFPPQWCWCNHAALVVDSDGGLIEALAHGLTQSDVYKYKPRDYAVVRPGLTDAEREKVVAWAKARFDEHRSYGWITIASEALICLTGTRLTFGVSGDMICSGFVAAALAEGGLDLGDSPEWMMPAGLAAHFRTLKGTSIR